MKLVPCERCGRHLRGGESTCPFCRAPRTRSILALVAMSSSLACAMATKYGAPPNTQPPDADPASQPDGTRVPPTATDPAPGYETSQSPPPDAPAPTPSPDQSSPRLRSSS
ncbi:MAG: hypothetical protein KBB21_35535 [Nannocystaceae bacterium]|nr:hypothetical protein [Deltaproteobacteria bacterium]MBP7291995.1 hypothetical protein [Nannocystaceae bacterium]